MKHHTVNFCFNTATGEQVLTMHNCTADEVLARAKLFGYKPRLWWQLWRPKALMVCRDLELPTIYQEY